MDPLDGKKGNLMKNSRMLKPSRVVFWYMLFAGLWIFFSDMLVMRLLIDQEFQVFLQTYKGWGFSIVTGLILYFILRYRYQTLEDIARAHAEEVHAQKELSERLQHYLAVSPTITYALKISGISVNPVWVSENVERVLGYSLEEALASNWWTSIMHPEDRSNIKIDDSSFSESDSAAYEYRIFRKDGSIAWIRDEFRRMEPEGKGEKVIVGTWTDITERKQSEEEFEKKTEEYETVFRSTQSAMFLVEVVDEETFRYVRNNHAHEKATGLSPEDLSGKSPLELLGKEIGGKIVSNYKRCVLTASPISYEETLDLPGGNRTWHTVLTPLFNQKGEATYLVGSSQDITDRKNAEDSLRKSEEKFRTLVENAFDAIYLMRGRRYEYVNSRFEELTGFKAEELSSDGFDFGVLLTEKSLKLVEQRYKMRLEGKTVPNQYELEIRTKDGVVRNVELSTAELGEKSEVLVLGIMRDISERKRTEEQIVKTLSLTEATIEATDNGILVVGRNGEVLKSNQRFAELWRIPDPLLLNGDDEKLINYVLDQLVDPDGFLSTVKELYKEPERESLDILHFKDRRVFERYSRPMKISGKTEGRVWSFRDVTERKHAEERIRHLSFHDYLTDLYNRAFIEEELRRLSNSRELPLGVLMCDVNGLKLVNDAFGHQEGDKLLQSFAKVLRESCRKEDLIGRWGGDEFLFLLPRADERKLKKLVERIKAQCAKASNSNIPISVSTGYAILTNAGQPVDAVIDLSEERMYRNKLIESRSARSSIITSLERTLRETTEETQEHAQRMRSLAREVGEALLLSSDELNSLELLASLHDIGKVGLPDSILSKPGPLTSDEWETVKKHPEIGYRIAQSSTDLLPIAEAILCHHERWDGSGYPQGLSKNEAPLLSRIIAVVDAYDVMTRGRPYKKAVSSAEALEELRRFSGTQFDPEVVEVFVKTVKE